jgi:hypothetical protein
VDRFFGQQGFGSVIFLGPGNWYGTSAALLLEERMALAALDEMCSCLNDRFGQSVHFHLIRPDRPPSDQTGLFDRSTHWVGPCQVAHFVVEGLRKGFPAGDKLDVNETTTFPQTLTEKPDRT